MSHFLMCRPTYFTVDYEINPWMSTENQVDRARAVRQFDRLVEIYRKLGCEVSFIPPKQELPDMVFTANGAVVRNGVALIANFRYPERQPETPLFEKWFQKHGLRTVRMPKSAILEGQGEAFFVNGYMFAGRGFRANQKGHEMLRKTFKVPVISAKLVDPRWYHFDTCFCPLRDEAVLYWPGAFDVKSRELIRRHTKRAIPVSRGEALDFVCNSVPVGKYFVTGSKPGAKTKKALRKLGYTVISTPLGEFKKSGGGARCLTLTLS